MQDNISGASFRTHLNYLKCLDSLLSNTELLVAPIKKIQPPNKDLIRFQKLDGLTNISIKKDIQLSQKEQEFALIAAPWFSVKCYYSLYYLESVLIYLIDGSNVGFTKTGHGAVRKKIQSLIISRSILFNNPDINRIYKLEEIKSFTSISSGKNAKWNYWQDKECTNSIAKKLMEYKLYDAKLGHKWNLRLKKFQEEQNQFISIEKITLLDFFFWYRIKANYRDLDFIDFENETSIQSVKTYIEIYYNAYTKYRNNLLKNIQNLLVKEI